MSSQTQAGKGRTPAQSPPPTQSPPPLEMIACDGCGRRFTTDDGPGMIALIKGTCPDCGGRFGLVDD
jgi:hypothetical protein